MFLFYHSWIAIDIISVVCYYITMKNLTIKRDNQLDLSYTFKQRSKYLFKVLWARYCMFYEWFQAL